MKSKANVLKFEEFVNESDERDEFISGATELMDAGILPEMAMFQYLNEENVQKYADNVDVWIAKLNDRIARHSETITKFKTYGMHREDLGNGTYRLHDMKRIRQIVSDAKNEKYLLEKMKSLTGKPVYVMKFNRNGQSTITWTPGCTLFGRNVAVDKFNKADYVSDYSIDNGTEEEVTLARLILVDSENFGIDYTMFVIEYIGKHSENLEYIELYVSPSANYWETEKKITVSG